MDSVIYLHDPLSPSLQSTVKEDLSALLLGRRFGPRAAAVTAGAEGGECLVCQERGGRGLQGGGLQGHPPVVGRGLLHGPHPPTHIQRLGQVLTEGGAQLCNNTTISVKNILDIYRKYLLRNIYLR